MTAGRWVTEGGHQSWSARADLWGAGRFVMTAKDPVGHYHVLADWGSETRLAKAIQLAEDAGLGDPGVAESYILQGGMETLQLQVGWHPLEGWT